jgi:LPXTG-site transpeptidase (sortase) family protein
MSQPTHFSVPVIGLSAPIQQVGLTKAGDMEVPLSETTLGWYQGGAYPGNPGPAVLAGHTGYPDKPAPFRKLEQLKKGDAITIEDVVGHKATFTVTETALYTPDTAPRERIFGPTSHAQLVVITCTGTWIPRAQTYSHRLVIYSIRTS